MNGLNDSDENARLCSAVVVGETRHIALHAVPALIASLRHKYPFARIVALKSLTKIGPAATDAVPFVLARQLVEKDIDVLYALTTTIRSIQPAVFKAMQNLIERDENYQFNTQKAFGPSGRVATLRRIAARALRFVNSPAVVSVTPNLIKALEDEDKIVRTEVAKTLGSIRYAAKTAIPDLIYLALEDKEPLVRASAAEALGEIAPGADTSTQNKVIVCLIFALKDPEESVRMNAAKSLGVFAKKRPVDMKMIPFLFTALNDGSLMVQASAAEALANMGPLANDPEGRLESSLKKFSKDHPDRILRAAAADALRKIQED